MPERFGYGFLRNRRYTQPVNAPRYYLLDKLDHTLDFYHSLEDLGESVEVNIPRDTWLVFPDHPVPKTLKWRIIIVDTFSARAAPEWKSVSYHVEHGYLLVEVCVINKCYCLF